MINKIKEYYIWILIGFILMIIHKLIEKYEIFFEFIGKTEKVLSPFIWGFVIAYFLVRMVYFLQRKFSMNKLLSIFTTYSIFIGFIVVFILIIAPVIVKNITDIVNLLSTVDFATVQSSISKNMQKIDLFKAINKNPHLSENIGHYSKILFDFLNKGFNIIVLGIINVTSELLKFILGIIISIYIIIDIDKFKSKFRKITIVFFGDKKANEIFSIVKMFDDVFKNFFVGKALDSLIVGIICYIGLKFLGVKYATLLSVIVGIFNMIPYVGPFIGAVPAVVLTFLVDPIKSLWVAVFILILQQVDGNIIGPKILEDKVGMSPFSSLLAIAIGGEFFGILGMFLAVPIYKIIMDIFDRYMDSKFENNI